MGAMPGRKVMLGASLAFVSALTAHAGSVPSRTVVSLTFDDAYQEHAAAREILDARGLKGTFYVNSPRIVGGNSLYLNRAQLDSLAAAGHEVGGHTLDHSNLTHLTAAEMRRQICDDRRALIDLGITPVSLAYPYGASDAAVQEAARDCGYANARIVGRLSCAGCPTAETLPPANPFAVRTPGSVRAGTTLAEMQQLVIDAEQSGGGWVPFVFHRICDGCIVYSVSAANLGAFADWLRDRASRGTVVLTVAQAMGGAPPPLHPAPAIAALNPANAVAGSSALTLNVFGEGFVSASTVRWNGSDRATVRVSTSHLTARITEDDLAARSPSMVVVMSAAVTVSNPEPGGGVSNSLAFGIVDQGAVDTADAAAFSWKELYAYPNPVHRGAVTFRAQPGQVDGLELRVYDSSGRPVHSSSDFRDRGALTYEHVWDVSGVASGVYAYVVTARKAGRSELRKSGKLGIVK